MAILNGCTDLISRITGLVEEITFNPEDFPAPTVLKLWLRSDQGLTLSLSPVTATGTNPPTVTLTGTPATAYSFIIQTTGIGILGVALFKWSSDNGVTYSSPQLTAASVVLGNTGITAHFGAGTYALNDQYTSYTTVSQWNDISGNGNDISQSTAALCPQLNNSLINGLPALRFSDAIGTYLINSNRSDLAPNTITMIAVTRWTLDQSINFIGGRGDTGFAGYWIAFSDDGSFWHVSNGTDIVQQTAGSTSINIWMIGTLTFNSSNVIFYVNGTQVHSNPMTGNINYVGSNDFIIGNIEGLTAGRGFTGDIAEILIYNSALSSDERNSIHQYLGARYNIAVS